MVTITVFTEYNKVLQTPAKTVNLKSHSESAALNLAKKTINH